MIYMGQMPDPVTAWDQATTGYGPQPAPVQYDSWRITDMVRQGVSTVGDITTAIIGALSAKGAQERALEAQKGSEIVPGINNTALILIGAGIIATGLIVSRGKR